MVGRGGGAVQTGLMDWNIGHWCDPELAHIVRETGGCPMVSGPTARSPVWRVVTLRM